MIQRIQTLFLLLFSILLLVTLWPLFIVLMIILIIYWIIIKNRILQAVNEVHQMNDENLNQTNPTNTPMKHGGAVTVWMLHQCQ